MTQTLIRNVRIASMQENGRPYGELAAGEILLERGKIVALGTSLPVRDEAEIVDAQSAWCLPGFIDCHTHLVYAGNRADEFAKRLRGVSYQAISAQGGGIKSTVRATREASEQQLVEHAIQRASRLAEEGVTTLEIKSGYGLDKETEVRMLNAAKQVGEKLGIHIQRTFLGAHALPPEADTDADAYIDFVCNTMIPYIAENQLADAVDVFCETVGFDLVQTRRVFEAARQAGLPVKGHVEQLSDSKGALLAASYSALSVDHIEYLDPSDVSALADAGTVAVLLPGAFYYLRETQLPPVEALRQHQIPMAISTDLNPGTSPIASLLTCANMACVLFRLTTEEALRGITCHAAKALNLANKGILREGADADLCLWQINSPDELVYEINRYRPVAKWVGGQRVI
ncbi:imidazolonepropionase [Alteromonas aestuariivivens]|uniref:Imidazolonepropionase n=1 Tax=Alteromonas aestuariivivens TaxID=1938339 RepID=A0A3D8M841_9ALTE|nr:imidazolonepropionase [Alteromonas aestuariivivens]RDV26055.1 imidazolonepropionase [Alteromonas aestuariivivens]